MRGDLIGGDSFLSLWVLRCIVVVVVDEYQSAIGAITFFRYVRLRLLFDTACRSVKRAICDVCVCMYRAQTKHRIRG